MTAILRLKRREDRRIRAGHLWIFSNEIDTAATPLKGLEAGAPVRIENADGRFLAHAYANPASLISARVTSRDARQPFDGTLLRARLEHALALRQRRYDEPFYRWVHGEGDFLPGLVVDRYDDALVVQLTTAGMECRRSEIVEMLAELSGAGSIALVNDTSVRVLEGLPSYRQQVHGGARDELKVRENDLDFTVPATVAQKTGWFYDHRDSRASLRNWVKGARVLELYCYLGAFGINALAGGAKEVVAIDASIDAVEAARANAVSNDVETRFEARHDDAVEAMRTMVEQGERFDVVVLDPPAFVKRRKDLDAGTRHYTLNNKLAMKLLAPGGILLSASCSQAVDPLAFERLLGNALPKTATGLQLLHPLRQAADHPVNAAMAETLYLKGSICRPV